MLALQPFFPDFLGVFSVPILQCVCSGEFSSPFLKKKNGYFLDVARQKRTNPPGGQEKKQSRHFGFPLW